MVMLKEALCGIWWRCILRDMSKDAVNQPDDATLDKVAQKAAQGAVERMHEFHKEDLKVLQESMEIRLDTFRAEVNEKFDRVDNRFDGLESRIGNIEADMSHVKDALQMLLEEFREHRQRVQTLEREVEDLRSRIGVLEEKLTSS